LTTTNAAPFSLLISIRKAVIQQNIKNANPVVCLIFRILKKESLLNQRQQDKIQIIKNRKKPKESKNQNPP
jgi:hypothetical protein